MTDTHGFTDEQKQYLQGFIAGADSARASRGLSTIAQDAGGAIGTPTDLTLGATTRATGPDAIHHEARARTEAEGGKLCKEEKAKRDKNPLDMWSQMTDDARAGRFPRGVDVFRYKYHGLFYVSPAQDSYMCRLRFAGGIVTSAQVRGVAELADDYGGGYAHVTTRANLQVREIGAADGVKVLTGLQDLGVLNQGSGGDNIRNVTASPTAGIDPQEVIDTRPLAREMHHHIMHHRELYGLPRKFNIAFDGGGRISSVADTNDIAFMAVRVTDDHADADTPAGVYFRMELGGITGHLDFSRDTGVLLEPDQCVPAAAAVVKTFIKHGDRTDRKKARLKYLLDRWGFERFMAEAESELPFEWRRVGLDRCERRGPVEARGHIGVAPQKQRGRNYIGVALPVGKLTTDQMRGLAEVADRFGSGTIRLTVWQNLLVSDIADADLAEARAAIEAIGLTDDANSFRAGLIACTGSTGCKFAASDTKHHATQIAEHLEGKLELDQPLNIHLTGCHHSCAQHYIGDIGLLGSKVPQGDDAVEGYHVYVGGGYGDTQGIGRELYRDVKADDAPAVLESMVRAYLDRRENEDESFHAFTNRHEIGELKTMCEAHLPAELLN